MKKQTEDPEHKAYLDVGHEDVGGSERGLDEILDWLAVELRTNVVSCERHDSGRVNATHVERDGMRRTVETERGGSEQEQEAHVW